VRQSRGGSAKYTAMAALAIRQAVALNHATATVAA
jgi:hypothetical protein